MLKDIETDKYKVLINRDFTAHFGMVTKVVGLTVESVGPPAKLNDMCEHYGIEVMAHAPLRKCWQGKDGKITHEELAYFTGITGRTNQDERDAGLLAWNYAGMPIRAKVGR